MKRVLISIALFAISTVVFAASTKVSGEDVYNKHCNACHAMGVAQAPKVHDQKAWAEKFDAAMAAVKASPEGKGKNDKELKKMAIQHLIGIVKKGKGAMPAGGMCPKCTNEEYAAAIKFMMSKPKKKN